MNEHPLTAEQFNAAVTKFIKDTANAEYRQPVEVVHPREAERRMACHGSARPCWIAHQTGGN